MLFDFRGDLVGKETDAVDGKCMGHASESSEGPDSQTASLEAEPLLF